MSKINRIGIDGFEIKKCNNSTIELWFGDVLGTTITFEAFPDIIKALQEAERLFGLQPVQSFKLTEYQRTLGKDFIPWTQGTQITCQNQKD
jgi:hypothetical protein